MKVKDLIKKLQELPPVCEVFVGYDGYYQRQEPNFELVSSDVVFAHDEFYNQDLLTSAPFYCHWAE